MMAVVRSSAPHVWEIKISQRRNLTCQVCGKRFSRYKTLKAKVGIVNRHPDGTVKVSDTVLAEMHSKMNSWHPEPNCGHHIVNVVETL